MHETIAHSTLLANNMRDIRHIFVDHLGIVLEENWKTVPDSLDFDADRVSEISGIEKWLAENEIGIALQDAENSLPIDRIPNHQTQAEFDRRLLGYSMIVENIHTFRNLYQFYLDFQNHSGAGNNAGQRAAYLGISVGDYDLIQNKFDPMAGVLVMLDTQKSLRWNELPEGYF